MKFIMSAISVNDLHVDNIGWMPCIHFVIMYRPFEYYALFHIHQIKK